MALNTFMRAAISVAEKALKKEIAEIPVGVVIVRNGEVISSAHNEREKTCDPTAHAEIVAIRRAAEKLQDWRLADCDLYVTLEPCPMCMEAIRAARIRRVYCGAYASRETALQNTEIYFGIEETACSDLLKQFFQNRRTENV